MARRVSLPAADDLFRPTSTGVTEAPPAPESAVRAVPDVAEPAPGPAPDPATDPATDQESASATKAAASGRIRHDEKMTVYVTSGELMAIEQARLTLRGEHRLAVDRGRLVREAVALVLADLAENADDSMLVQRLRGDR